MGKPDPMLTVACCLWGDWPEFYVPALKRAVDRHLSADHRFVCLTDRRIDGIETLPLPVTWPRNLRKMWLYAPDNGLEGRVLALDLDDIPVGLLDPLAAYRGPFCCIEDPWQPGLAGGGTVAFEAGDPMLIVKLYQPCMYDIEDVVSISGGAERHWLRHAVDADFWPPGLIADAKPQGRQEIVMEVPRGTSIMHFHGRPRPHEVSRSWLDSHWITPR